MTERVIAEAERIYRWEGPKRKQTLFSAKLGRAVLTSERLLFLSTGKNDLTVAKLAAGAAGHHLAAQRASDTSGLNLDALANPGSLEIPLGKVGECELKGMFKVLTVNYTNASGVPEASTFAPKNGGMPAGADWIVQITAACALRSPDRPDRRRRMLRWWSPRCWRCRRPERPPPVHRRVGS